ncbi:Pyridoxamine 5'-phosphate oxidase [Friedmanniella luteola]|uniref:Pyridoxamine 5'-phosphate oxidase n=1 Tax=Friedmanniella luteola TaxID=546871 RepID=A0A1H1MSJ5_9ACTN|nr:pyridoxamine 5'-phosphate oxidase family protein [Friedmanniella luteola]SDR89335.1 Pyridoxamine 5'-phosphate oxidase [Friedmanniella luteola]
MTPAAHPLPLAPSPGSPGDPVPTPARPAPRAVLDGLTDVLASYRTCELATVTRAGTPVAWPAVSWYDRAAGRLVLTTSIALPRKAFNVRRDPRVALLFSDPTGSGRADLPQVLVQGTAHCPDEIRTSPEGLETYWRELWRRQPGSSGYGSTPLDRWLFDFYYMRLVLTVDPTSVTTQPPLVRPAPPRGPKPSRTDDSPYGQVARRLPGYSDGVLATVTGDAPPVLRRVRPSADPTTGTLLLAGGEPVEVPDASSANLLLHRHDDQLGRLRQFGLVGTLEPAQDLVALRPTRVLAAAEATTPLSLARTVRRLRRSTQRYLDRRGLPRPTIPWADYRRLASGS